MKRLAATIYLDMLVQARSKLYVIAIGLALLLGFGMRYLLPREKMPLLLPLFYLFTIGGTAYLFVAGMVVFEKSEGTLDAQIISPLKVNEYLLAKVISLLLVVLIESFLVLALAYGFESLNLGLYLAGLALMSIGLTLGGFIQVSRYKSVTDFMLPAGTILVALQLPWLGLTGLAPSPLWYLIPTTAPTLLLMAAFEPIAIWQMIYAWIYPLALIVILFIWARRAFYQNLILRDG